MFRNYLKIAVRTIRSNKAFSAINIAGLSIGLACCMLIFLYIKDELSFDSFHVLKDRLYQLTCVRTEQDGSTKKFSIAALVQGPAFKQEIPEIKAFTRVNAKNLVIKRGSDVFNEQITWVDDDFFTLFSFPLLYGDPSSALRGYRSIVLSEASAVKYFGTANAVGKTLELEIGGKFEPFQVSAVAENAPQNSSIRFNMLAPFAVYEIANPDNGWMWVSFPTYFLLSPGASIEHVNHQMDLVYLNRAKDEIDLNTLAGYGNRFNWSLKPLTAMHLNTDYEGTPGAGDPIYSYILGGISILILVIASINFINLTVAQSLKRRPEIGIRKVMGSTRRQLMVQFLSESLVICLIAFVFACMVAGLALPVFNALADKKLSLGYLFDGPMIAGFVLLFLITGIAAGFYPALVLSGFKPLDALAGKSGLGGGGLLAKGLVVVQFALATFLIVSTLFVYAQFNLLTRTPVGYPDQNLVSFTVSDGVRNKSVMDLYDREFAGIPGVAGVGYRNIGLFGGKTLAGKKELSATYERIDAGYLPTLGATIIAGRNFSPEFPTDSDRSVLINQTFANQAGWKNPIGRTIDYMNFPGWGSRTVTVVGLVKDYHDESLKEKIKPTVFTGDAAMPLGQMIVRLRPERTAATLLAMERTHARLAPSHPFQYAFKDEANRRSYETEDKWKKIIALSAVITILISSIGLLGLSILTAKRREKEIGIRKVLGASVGALAGLLSLDFARLVLIAFLFAIPAGWLVMHRWLQNFPYRVELSWWRFVAAGGIALLIAMLTVSYHAIKAALANPVNSIRNQ